jgi:hypothetical protein
MEKQLQDMFHEIGPEPTCAMAQIVERLTSMDEKDAITATAYGVAGVSGYAATGETAVPPLRGTYLVFTGYVVFYPMACIIYHIDVRHVVFADNEIPAVVAHHSTDAPQLFADDILHVRLALPNVLEMI